MIWTGNVGICIKTDVQGKPEAVSYSGQTYTAILSRKHLPSFAFDHGLNFERLLDLEEFNTIIKDKRNEVIKPIVVYS